MGGWWISKVGRPLQPIVENVWAPPHPFISGKNGGGELFRKYARARFRMRFWVFFVLRSSKIPKIFFARTFCARESPLYLFGRGRVQKQCTREPVRLTLCWFSLTL